MALNLIQEPYYWLCVTICANFDLLKMIPLLLIYISYVSHKPHDDRLFDFLMLGLGDFTFIFVQSTEDTILFYLGLSCFLIFLGRRFICDGRSCLSHPFSQPLYYLLSNSLAFLFFYIASITQFMIRIYVHLLVSLITLQLFERRLVTSRKTYIGVNWFGFWGYLIYALSDLLLLISLSSRFWGDWFLVRLLYWTGLALIYSQP